MQNIGKIIDLISKSIKDDPELLLTQWGIIKDNYDSKVDEYRDILNNSKDWLAEYQARLIEKTWISTLKIKYTNVSGYFIEVPKSQTWKILDDFIQKQTLVNASRYITKELKDFEEKYNSALNFLASREYDIFQEVRLEILDNFNEIKKLSEKVAYTDFLSWFANLAYYNNYSRPAITKKYDLDIIQARHPVLEHIEDEFISNDLKLDKSEFIHIITWPNMWWKSTFLRQNALIILMSHLWSFVPAKKAVIPLTDKIFSRVWASDNLFLWQSTFMVEMQEMANILNNATKNSFIIIDEIGRWTSTFDWMSLAFAILKNLYEKIKAKVLFATHYHELVDESVRFRWVKSFSVAVSENNWNLVFLRKIIAWALRKSFWIEVAKLAWINNEVLNDAKNMLRTLEKNSFSNSQLDLWFDTKKTQIIEKIIYKESEQCNKLKNIDINNLTPIEALNLLSQLKK